MKKLKFGIIGMGIGAIHAKHLLKNPNVEVYAVCDTDESKLIDNPQLSGYQPPISTTDYNEIIQNPDIDIVDVASPDHLHCQHAVAALQAGKHVFCEKPLALTIEDCKQIIAAEKKAKGKFFVGQVCRYTPGFLKAKELYDSGLIGDLFFIESEYAHDYSHFPEDHWRRDPAVKRYAMIGGGCHAVDLLRWFAGNPVEVFAYGNQKCLTDWPPVMDANIAVYKFPNDVMGKVFCATGCKRPYTMRTVIYGTKGTIICDNTSPTIQIYSEGIIKENKALEDAGFVEVPVDIDNHNFASELNDFVEAITKKETIILSASEGANTVIACEAAVRSALEGEKVQIDCL